MVFTIAIMVTTARMNKSMPFDPPQKGKVHDIIAQKHLHCKPLHKDAYSDTMITKGEISEKKY